MSADQQMNIAWSKSDGCQLMHNKILLVHAYTCFIRLFVATDHFPRPASVNEDIYPVAGLDQITWCGKAKSFIESQLKKIETDRRRYRCLQGHTLLLKSCASYRWTCRAATLEVAQAGATSRRFTGNLKGCGPTGRFHRKQNS